MKIEGKGVGERDKHIYKWSEGGGTRNQCRSKKKSSQFHRR